MKSLSWRVYVFKAIIKILRITDQGFCQYFDLVAFDPTLWGFWPVPGELETLDNDWLRDGVWEWWPLGVMDKLWSIKRVGVVLVDGNGCVTCFRVTLWSDSSDCVTCFRVTAWDVCIICSEIADCPCLIGWPLFKDVVASMASLVLIIVCVTKFGVTSCFTGVTWSRVSVCVTDAVPNEPGKSSVDRNTIAWLFLGSRLWRMEKVCLRGVQERDM